MTFYLLKIVVSALAVLLVSEVAKRSSLFGGLIASIPTVSLLAILWLYAETRSPRQVAGLAGSIFWLTIPSLSFFLSLNLLLQKGTGFTAALLLAVLITVVCYGAMLFALHRLGVTL
jgi:F0F1-type ATP synthase assembly protein I